MNKFFIPILVAGTVFATGAAADNGWGHGRHWKGHKHHRPAPVVTYYYPYAAPLVVYQPAPVVIRERVVIREEPAYYYEAPHYQERPAAYGGNRMLGTTIGAIAGAALGSQVGSGNGRTAATAIGAVVGGAMGGQ